MCKRCILRSGFYAFGEDQRDRPVGTFALSHTFCLRLCDCKFTQKYAIIQKNTSVSSRKMYYLLCSKPSSLYICTNFDSL